MWRCRCAGGRGCAFDPLGRVDDGAAGLRQSFGGSVFLCHEMSILPGAGGCVVAEEEQSGSYDEDDTARNDEGNAPCDVRTVALVLDERVVDGGHEEVCHTTPSVAEAGDHSVSSTNDVLVEEACGPDLARNERAAENACQAISVDISMWTEGEQ